MRLLGCVPLAFAATLLVASPTRADAPESPLRATALCEAPPGPGRFRCDVELRTADGTFSWAEVVVAAVDDFVLPLRGRLGPRDATTHDPDIYRWGLGFVAKGRGTGKVTLRLRAVVCHGETCVPAETEVSARVMVADDKH